MNSPDTSKNIKFSLNSYPNFAENQVIFKGISTYKFRYQFKTSDDRYSYLHNLKWENSNSCSKCNHDKSSKGRTKWYLRCAKCKNDKFTTLNTLFHKIKLPDLKSFEIIFLLSNRKKGISALEIARTYEVNPDTASLIRKKTQQAILSNGNNKLNGLVQVTNLLLEVRNKVSKEDIPVVKK